MWCTFSPRLKWIMKKQFNILMAAMLLGGSVSATVLNEWNFEADSAAQTLSQATNSGSEPASFSADTALVTQTDGTGGLVCAHVAAGSGGLWTNGAVLAAGVTPVASGVRYLRYDVEYDMSSPSIDSGTLLGFAFADNVSNDLAGVALRYRIGNPVPPSGVVEQPVALNLNLTGTIAVIAEVNLTEQTMNVWYDLSDSNTFDYDTPSATVSNLSLSAIDQLEFRATGDFIAGASECAVVEELRTATTWDEISGSLADYTQPPVPEIVLFDDELDGRMLPGETNTLRVVIQNKVSPASHVTSILSFDGDLGDFTIIPSNTPVAVGANRTVTNTYQIISHTVGQFLFTAQAVSDGILSDPVDLRILSGARITAGFYSITNEVGGIMPGRPEPGESFDLIVSNLNSGAVDLSNITNSLSAENSEYFPSITPGSTNIPSLDVDDVVLTTYRVSCAEDTPGGLQTFTVLNQTTQESWTNQFLLDVFRQSLLEVTNALTIHVAPGETESVDLILLNEGNMGTTFTVTDDNRLTDSYTVTPDSVRRESFSRAGLAPETVFDDWDETNSVPMDIGFDFQLFGTTYHEFSVNQAGFVTLTSTTGEVAELFPFRSNSEADQSTIRYEKDNDQLVIAWGNTYEDDEDTLEFQVVLSVDGSIQYLYEYEYESGASWGAGEIGLSNERYEQILTHTPGQKGRDALHLSPDSWLTIAPPSGTISGFGGEQTLTFSVEAPASALGEEVSTVTITGDDNAVAVVVTVVVEAEIELLAASTNFVFSGPAGFISPQAILTMTNAGNVSLDYTITDRGLADAGYTNESVSPQWREIPDVVAYEIEESDLGAVPVEIGFPFIFFGNTFTSLVVEVDGTLTFENGDSLSVYPAGLSYDNNSLVLKRFNVSRGRFVVTWKNMAELGAGDDQTFQVELYPDGSIFMNYFRLDDLDVTNDVNWVSQESVERNYAIPRLFSFDPAYGTLLPGETAEITLTGDARSLSAGGDTNAVAETTLEFNYSTTNVSVDVTFIATNSLESAFASQKVRAAMWGSDDPVVSSTLNAEGSRTLSWPAPADRLSRAYTVWFATRLGDTWQPLAVVKNGTSFVDDEHNNEPVVFYKVTVQ